jgi:CelD/BcsL family acetyltransferase involved in cellulose biosynthesis
VAKELWEALASRDDWRGADLRGLPEDRPWLGLLADAAAGIGLEAEVVDDQNGVAPFLALPDTWEGYLEGLPAKLRHEIKRKAKKLEAETGPYGIVTATRENLHALLDRFVELHRKSEGPKGVFMQPGMEIFFRRLGETFGPAGIFRLTFIEVGGQLAAGTIGFEYGGTFSSTTRLRPHVGWARTGMVLVGEDIRLAIEDGCGAFDLLKGDYQYKYRFGAVPRAVKRIVVTR